VKRSQDYVRRLGTLLRKIRAAHPADSYEVADPIGQLIYGFLHWNAPRRTADAAMAKIVGETVDHNDLRVSHTHEIVALLGDRYPAAHERATRLRETLHEVFKREHILSLDKMLEKTKRDIRLYLEDLPGIAPFVAAHVSLVVFAGHAVPVDDRLAKLLRSEEVVNPDFTLPQITGFLERNIRAATTSETHASLMAWVDAGADRVTLARVKKKKSTRASTPSSATKIIGKKRTSEKHK